MTEVVELVKTVAWTCLAILAASVRGDDDKDKVNEDDDDDDEDEDDDGVSVFIEREVSGRLSSDASGVVLSDMVLI